MAREKGMGSLQREKSGRWTMRVCIDGKRYARSTRTRDRDQAERFLQRFLSPLGLGERRLPLADVWLEYVKSPNRNELAKATLDSKRNVWMHFARWMEHNYLPVKDLGGVTADMVGEYLACLRADLCASTYNNRVCVLREIFHTLAAKAGVEDDPWEGVRLRPDDSHSRRELTMDELRRLLEAAKGIEKAKVKGEGEEKKVGGESRSTKDGSTCSVGHGRSASPIAAAFTAQCDASLSRECGRAGTLAPTAPQKKMEDSAVDLRSRPTFSSRSEWHTLFLIGIYTGLRLGDCCRLDWLSINLAEGVIQLIPQKTRRHAHGRPVTIPIHPALGEALGFVPCASCVVPDAVGRDPSRGRKADAAEGRGPSPSAFDSTTKGTLNNECGALGDRPLPFPTAPSTKYDAPRTPTSGPVLPTIAAMYATSRSRVSGMLARIFKKANVTTSVKIEGRRNRTPEATFHSLRHTFVSFAANAGVPLHIVQSIVGHESTAMTRHYYHENITVLKSAVAAIPTLTKGTPVEE